MAARLTVALQPDAPQPDAPRISWLDDIPEASANWAPQDHFDLAIFLYRGLFSDWFPADERRLQLRGHSRERTIVRALRQFELSSSASEWEVDETARLMHGHLSCLVAWSKRISGDNQETKRMKAQPPQPPLTVLDLIVDAFPSYDGLRACFLARQPSPADVLNALKRRQRWLEYYEGEHVSSASFEQ
jgi:hypothetical protein